MPIKNIIIINVFNLPIIIISKTIFPITYAKIAISKCLY